MRANILTLVSALTLALSSAGCLLQPLSSEEAAELRAEVESMGLGGLDLDYGVEEDFEPGAPESARDSSSTVIDTSSRLMGGSVKPDPTPWVTATPDGKPDPTPWRTAGDNKPDPTPWYPTSSTGTDSDDETFSLYSDVEGKPDPTPW